MSSWADVYEPRHFHAAVIILLMLIAVTVVETHVQQMRFIDDRLSSMNQSQDSCLAQGEYPCNMTRDAFLTQMDERDRFGSPENNTVSLEGRLIGFSDIQMMTVADDGACKWDDDPIQTQIFGIHQSDYRFQFMFETQEESVVLCIYRDTPEYIKTIGGDHRKKWEWAAETGDLEIDDPFNGYALHQLRNKEEPVRLYTDKNGTVELTDVDVDLWYTGDTQ